ncbi:MAG: hypothetical protein IJT73_08575, partial [Selenomonadaceae bacterium]|nr:hypothetical protein [Selenomonadaceae bacterium]
MAEKDLESRVSSLETNFAVFVQEMRDFKDEMRDFKAEMRQQNEMRAAEIARTDAKIETSREKHDADIKELNQKIDDKFDKLSNQIHTTAIATILGVGAIVVAVMGFAWAIFTPDKTEPPVQTPPAATAQIQTADNAE